MRKLIIDRLNEMRKVDGFTKQSTRWKSFEYTEAGNKKTHISELDFDKLNDFLLIKLFESVVRRFYTQM